MLFTQVHLSYEGTEASIPLSNNFSSWIPLNPFCQPASCVPKCGCPLNHNQFECAIDLRVRHRDNIDITVQVE